MTFALVLQYVPNADESTYYGGDAYVIEQY